MITVFVLDPLMDGRDRTDIAALYGISRDEREEGTEGRYEHRRGAPFSAWSNTIGGGTAKATDGSLIVVAKMRSQSLSATRNLASFPVSRRFGPVATHSHAAPASLFPSGVVNEHQRAANPLTAFDIREVF